MRSDAGRVTLTEAEMRVVGVVYLAGEQGAPLAGATRPEHSQVESRAARRLAKQGFLTIDAGGVAHLTDRARDLM